MSTSKVMCPVHGLSDSVTVEPGWVQCAVCTAEEQEASQPECPYWTDGKCCFTADSEDSEGNYATPRTKACACGKEVKRR